MASAPAQVVVVVLTTEVIEADREFFVVLRHLDFERPAGRHAAFIAESRGSARVCEFARRLVAKPHVPIYGSCVTI